MNRVVNCLSTSMTDWRLRDAEPGADGAAPDPADPAPAAADPAPQGDGEAKPFLGETPAAEPPPSDQPQGDAPPGGETPPPPDPAAPPTEEDYGKALVKDEALLGADKNVQLDADLYRACVPVMQKYGVSPEAANALANALAKAQIDDAKARMQSRVEYFERMKQESLRTYTPRDFETINAGIDRWFKPGGVMNNVIRNSELGADPEFLALMHHLGGRVAEDDAAGARAAGGGSGNGDPNSSEGMSRIW